MYTEAGRRQTREAVDYYMGNAKLIKDGLEKIGLTTYGGVNAPYIWVQMPDGMPSRNYFDFLLRQAGLVTTPGAGFGACGEGFIRLTAFGQREQVAEAIGRLQSRA